MENPLCSFEPSKAKQFIQDNQTDHIISASNADDPEFFIRRSFHEDPLVGCELLYHRYYQNLCSYATRYVMSKEIAEDIVSDIFLHFWKNATYQQVHLSYGAYLYRSVRNRAISHLRKELHQGYSMETSADERLIDHDTPEAIMHFQDLTHRLDAEIQALPAQCRRAFTLNRYEGKKYNDIAQELQISQKAVEHLISRALKRLRTHLNLE
jgi:RNA polymerase sigma-70 factor (ECF subfamily)